MCEFGELLKEILQISNIKYSVLSSTLNFDSSYISKWITTDLLPSEKNAGDICQKISNLVNDYIDSPTRNKLCVALNIPTEELDISTYLYNQLYTAYLNELDGIKSKVTTKKQAALFEDVFTPSSAKNRDEIIKSINNYRKKSDSIHFYIIGDILDSSYNDLIFLMDLKYLLKELEFKEINFSAYLSRQSLESEPKDDIAICFLNFLLIELQANVQYYHVEIQHSGLILYIKDYFVYQAHFLLNNEWLLSHCSTNKKRVAYFNTLINRDIEPIGRRLFNIFDYNEIYDFNNMLQIYNCKATKILLGIIDTSLFSYEFLTLLFSMSNIPAALIDNWLKKHKIFESLIQSGEEIQIIIYRGAMNDFVYNGHIKLANQDFFISVKHRVQALECMIDTLNTYDNVKVRFVETFLVNEIKHPNLPTLYLGKNSAYSLMSPKNNCSRFVSILNSELIQYFSRTFDSIWDENLVTLLDGNKVIKEYSAICREILSFELMI